MQPIVNLPALRPIAARCRSSIEVCAARAAPTIDGRPETGQWRRHSAVRGYQQSARLGAGFGRRLDVLV